MSKEVPEKVEDCFRQALNLLRKQDTIKCAEAALIFGSFLIKQCNRHSEGCALIMESIRLYIQMELPREKDANEISVQLCCIDANSTNN